MYKIFKTLAFLLTPLAFNPNAMATIITFDGEIPVFVIPGDYGSRISTNSGSFIEGNGFTSNVALSYSQDVGSENFSVWDGYSTLDNALGHNNFNIPGEIIFTPDSGFGVQLNSFDYAAWAGTYPARITIFDGLSNILFDSGSFTLAESDGEQNLTFSSPLVSTSSLRIRFEDFGDLAIDNINFDQFTTNVPEPTSLSLFAIALLAIRRLRMS